MDRSIWTNVDSQEDHGSRDRSRHASLSGSFDDRPTADNEFTNLVVGGQRNLGANEANWRTPYLWDIGLASAAVSGPMLALIIVLLWLTLAFRLDQRSPWFRSAEYPGAASDSAAIYIALSATTYVTVASWASNVGTTITASVMVLYSYLTAKRFLSSQTRPVGPKSYSPTPYQLNLFLQARGASLRSFWDMMCYRRWKVRSSLAGMVVDAYRMLAVVLILGANAPGPSYAIWAADTWLHLSTESTLMTCSQVDSGSVTQNYSYQLNCFDDGDGNTGSCSTGDYRIWQVTEAFQALNNLSDTYGVSTLRYENQTYAFLSHADLEYGLDFEAHTFAITTQCIPVQVDMCNISCDPIDYRTSYTCPSGIRDTLKAATSSSGLIMSHTQFTIGDPIHRGRLRDTNFTNPVSFVTLASSTSFNSKQANDSDNIILCPYLVYGMATWLLNCSATTFEIDYRWQNSSARITNLVQSNDTIAATLASPFLEDIGSFTLYNAISTAMGESNAAAAAETYGEVFSKTAMALAAGVFVPGPNLSEARLCAGSRVLVAPLVTLLSLMMIYVLEGVVLGVLALMNLTKDVAEAQARLTIRGLTAHAFETEHRHASAVDDLFEEKSNGESPRILLVKTAGWGWRFVKDEFATLTTKRRRKFGNA